MRELYERFEEYCKTPGVDSGKARSYTKAIEYLCEYLKICVIDSNTVAQIKQLEDEISDKNSSLYKDLLHYLTRRGQKSYLEKGFIKAALKYFFELVR